MIQLFNDSRYIDPCQRGEILLLPLFQEQDKVLTWGLCRRDLPLNAVLCQLRVNVIPQEVHRLVWFGLEAIDELVGREKYRGKFCTSSNPE